MICPECKTEFRGSRFFISRKRGAFRRCPQGHEFKEPKRSRKTSERAFDVLAKIKAWDIAHYMEHGRFALPQELHELMEVVK